MNDPEAIQRGLRLLECKPRIEATLAWMIKHFDFERDNQQWGSESPELLEAKALKEKIDNI